VIDRKAHQSEFYRFHGFMGLVGWIGTVREFRDGRRGKAYPKKCYTGKEMADFPKSKFYCMAHWVNKRASLTVV
jgi:hypothetical protein